MLNHAHVIAFQKKIKNFYQTHGRAFPWRSTQDPYQILVSEFMLQQTQTARVEPKYLEFCATFPTIEQLANAPLASVLKLWQGLGYNRRAQYLLKTAQTISLNHNGVVPDNPEILKTLPGIGNYTANAIAAFAYNKPTIFIETNIRAVFLKEFFPTEEEVHDAEILALVEKTVDQKNPRAWYYALMDYGVFIKAEQKNIGKRSAHYVRQSQFHGSRRQIRGAILRLLTEYSPRTVGEFAEVITDSRLLNVITELESEQLITRTDNHIHLGTL